MTGDSINNLIYYQATQYTDILPNHLKNSTNFQLYFQISYGLHNSQINNQKKVFRSISLFLSAEDRRGYGWINSGDGKFCEI